VRRLVLSALAAFAFLRFLRWRRAKAAAVAPEAVPEAAVDPRAEELRAKVESRAGGEAETREVPAADPAERRQSVHERGRRAAEQMRGPAPD